MKKGFFRRKESDDNIEPRGQEDAEVVFYNEDFFDNNDGSNSMTNLNGNPKGNGRSRDGWNEGGNDVEMMEQHDAFDDQVDDDNDQLLKSTDSILKRKRTNSLDGTERIQNAADPQKFPKRVGFIIGQEFCERFSYYGMRAVLPLYLLTFFDQDIGTTVMHTFTMLAYFFPLLGGFISDSYWGKFKTILILSIVYCAGNIVMATTSIPAFLGDPPSPWGMFVALGMIALGTGGIKPCVASFGGDQFHPTQKRYIEIFFSMFYFSINTGSLISMVMTPLLRGNVTCFGASCYPLAFGVPAVLMFVATIFFLFGSKVYTKVPPQGNVLVKVGQVIIIGIKGKWQARSNPRTSVRWLDYAVSQYGEGLVKDVKALLSVFTIFAPLPIFWALFDQQSSRWTYQAINMDRNITIMGHETIIQPDLIQVLNPLFCIMLIPFFQGVVYPIFAKCGLELRPLQKMGIGLVLCSLSFTLAGFVGLSINQSVLSGPDPTRADCENGCCISNCVPVWLQIPQYFVITTGEIMFSVTGLEFAYSQAPKSMKSVCQAAWLLTSALGNVLVIIIAVSKTFENRAAELFFYSALMFVFFLLFLFLARRHKYVTPS